MLDERAKQIYDGVEHERGRDAYPTDFPNLPEVPIDRYTDAAFYDLEMKHFWPKTWLWAGHVNEIPEPGSYKLFERLGQSVIIARGNDGQVRAFHNVCTHRASSLVQEPHGSVRRFTCPYHAWTFSLDGRLVAVPDQARNFACLDKADHGLVPVRCETMRGMIYLNLDGNALPLSEYFATTEQELGSFPLEQMVVRGELVFEMDCNWKASYDNFLEIYHVSTVHAKSIAPFLDSKSFVVSLFKHGHARFATRKKGASTIFGKDLVVPDTASALFKDHTIGLPMFPNGFAALDPVGFGWQTWWPLARNKSLMVTTLMGWKDQDEAFWTDMKAQMKAISVEDLFLFSNLQRSYESGVRKGAVMSYQEQQLYWYQEELDRQIGVENIPEHLRIRPVLASQVQD